MKITSKNDEFAIFDEVFDNETYEKFVKFFCDHDFVRNSGKHEKVWRVCDGEFLAGKNYFSQHMPFNNPLDWLCTYIKILVKDHVGHIVGKEGEDWEQWTLRPYIYPAGTRISWHNDYGFSAACIFYCHKEWSPSWGGELMVAKVPTGTNAPNLESISDDDFSRKKIKPLLDYYGLGSYICCLPNRLVFTKGNVWHTINRVDKDAGENLRFSIVVFFMKKDKK